MHINHASHSPVFLRPTRGAHVRRPVQSARAAMSRTALEPAGKAKFKRVIYEADAIVAEGLLNTVRRALTHLYLNADPDDGFSRVVRSFVRAQPHGIDIRTGGSGAKELLARFDTASQTSRAIASQLENGLLLHTLATHSPRLISKSLMALITSQHIDGLKVDERLRLHQFADEPGHDHSQKAMISTLHDILENCSPNGEITLTAEGTEFPRLRVKLAPKLTGLHAPPKRIGHS